MSKKIVDKTMEEKSGRGGLLATMAVVGILGALLWFFISRSND